MKIRFVEDAEPYSAGDEVDNLPDEVAEAWVGAGVAEVVEDAPKGDEPPEEEKTRKSVREQINKAIENHKPQVKVPAQVQKPTFSRFGDWLRCKAYSSYYQDRNATRKLHEFQMQRKAAQGQTEADADHYGSDTVPTVWANELWEKVRSEFVLVDKFKSYQATADTINVPVLNDTSRATGSRPLRYYAISEGNDFTYSKMVTATVALTPYKYGVLAASTRELLEDSNSNFEQIISDQIVKELRFALNDLAVNGSGSSAPTGLLNAACKITVSKGGSQGSQTLWLQNLAKMVKRLPYGAASRAFFVYNRSILDQMIQLAFDPAASSLTPAWGLTYNVASETPLTFQGIPMFELETCQTLGIAGDIILVDPSAIAYFMKPIELAASEHVLFASDQVAYRGRFRVDIKPLYTAAETPFNGNQTTSPVICLESRGST